MTVPIESELRHAHFTGHALKREKKSDPISCDTVLKVRLPGLRACPSM